MSHPNTAILNDRAFELLDRGDRQGAKVLFEQVCTLDSQESEATMMIGVILAEEGDFPTAEKHIRRALELDPEYADAHYYLGSVLQARGQVTAALTSAERAVELEPEFADAQKLLVTLQQMPGNSASAQVSIHETDTLSSTSQQIFNQANTLLQQGQLEEAATCFESVTRQQPDLAAGWFMLGRTRSQQTQYNEAVRCCKKAIRLDSGLVEGHLMLATVFLMQGKIKEACNHSDMALKLAPADINAIALAANIAKHMGQPEKSYELLSPLLEKGVQQINIALAFAIISKDLGRQQQAIDLMEEILNSDQSLSTTGKSNIHFNLGALYDSIKQYDQAFLHYRQGNALKQLSFDRQQHESIINKHIATHNAEFMAALPRASLPSYSQHPIFVVGMVRSGTSLVEQILSSHPDVYGAGELGDIYQISNALPGFLGASSSYPECLSQLSQQHVDHLAQLYLVHLKQISPDAKHVVDKLPGNFMHLGLIELLFPDAHVIHCMRNPVDTCLSAYFQDFSSNHPYAYDLENLGVYYKGYLKLMEHWRKVLTIPLLEINYEDLIADQEQVSRSLLEFCGLKWDESCLRFHKTERFVRTASYDQVNRPLYKQSVARWKNYESHLQPLLAALKG